MIDIIKVALLSASPFFELRGGIPLGLALGLDALDVYLLAVFFNFLAVPVIFFFLDNLHNSFMKNRYYGKLFNKYVLKNRKKLEKYMGTRAEFWALMLIVMVPLPGTGAYTGSILAWFFGLKRRKSYVAILLGIIVAGLLVMAASLGVIALI